MPMIFTCMAAPLYTRAASDNLDFFDALPCSFTDVVNACTFNAWYLVDMKCESVGHIRCRLCSNIVVVSSVHDLCAQKL